MTPQPPSQPVAQDSERERCINDLQRLHDSTRRHGISLLDLGTMLQAQALMDDADNIGYAIDKLRKDADLERENEALRAHIESVKRLGREWLLSRTGESIEPRDAGNAVFAALNRTITPEGGRTGDGERT